MDAHGSVSMPNPAPSEWGKINSGQAYGILAIDLGRAIFGVSWGKYELPLIQCLIEQSWKPARSKERGKEWPDPEPCKLNLNALANRWKYPRQRLYEARDRLEAIGFLVADADGYWVNKNADEWIDPLTRKPLLSPEMLDYALEARVRKSHKDKQSSVTLDRDIKDVEDVGVSRPKVAESDRSDKQESVTLDRDTVSRSSVTSENASTVVCHVPALHDVTVQRDIMSRSSVTSHIERAPEEDIKTELDCSLSLARAGEGRLSSPSLREPKDRADLEEALDVLSQDERTIPLAMELGRMHGSVDCLGIAGWRWIVAAYRIVAKPDPENFGFRYLRATATKVKPSDLDKIRAERVDLARAVDSPAPPRRPTAAEQKRKAEIEMMHRIAKSLPENFEEDPYGRT